MAFVPCLESNPHLDFTGKILNSLKDWISLENDVANDIVLMPRYVTQLMSKMARTNMNLFVWDKVMGSASFLVSAMDIMIQDAREKMVIKDVIDWQGSAIIATQAVAFNTANNKVKDVCL